MGESEGEVVGLLYLWSRLEDLHILFGEKGSELGGGGVAATLDTAFLWRESGWHRAIGGMLVLVVAWKALVYGCLERLREEHDSGLFGRPWPTTDCGDTGRFFHWHDTCTCLNHATHMASL